MCTPAALALASCYTGVDVHRRRSLEPSRAMSEAWALKTSSAEATDLALFDSQGTAGVVAPLPLAIRWFRFMGVSGVELP